MLNHEKNQDISKIQNLNSDKFEKMALEQKTKYPEIINNSEDQQPDSTLLFKSNKVLNSIKNNSMGSQESKINDINSNNSNDFVILSFPDKKILEIIQKICNFFTITISELDYILDYSKTDLKYLMKNNSISASQVIIIINVIMNSFCNYKNEFANLKKYLEKVL